MFEHHRQPLIPIRAFILRMIAYAISAFLLLAVSWFIGILGYRILESMPWIDATLNAAMILGGMGPVSELHTNGGKIFASFYAIFSGVIFLFSIGVLLAPLVHRLMHKFHLNLDQNKN